MRIYFYQSISLTTATETKVLTAGNDTVDGSVANSLNNDIIVDSSSTDSDVLNAVITANAAATITNVETSNIDFKGFNLTFDATSVTGGKLVASTSMEFNDKATVTNLANKGVNVDVGSNVKILTVSGTTASTDATTVKLAGGALALTTNSVNAIETVGINSTGSSDNTVTLTSATTAETFNVTGDKSLTLKVAGANVTGDTVTKALTGSATLTVELSGATVGTNLVKVANDKITTASTGVTALTGGTLSLAAGTTNLELNQAAIITAVSGIIDADGALTTDVLNLKFNKAQTFLATTDFETVNLTVATGEALTFSNDSHTVGTGGVLNVISSQNVDFGTTGIVAKTVDASGMTGTGKLTVKMANNSANSITVTGTANADSITLGQTTAGKTATVSAGNGDNTVTGTTSSQNMTITTGTGNDTITGGSGSDTIISGAGNDTLTLTKGNNYAVTDTGNDSITLGTGADAVVAGAGDDIVVAGLNLLATDTLSGGDGSDTLTASLAATATYTLAFGDNFTGFEALSLSGTQAKAYNITTHDANVAAGTEFTVSTTALKFGFNFDGSAETDGKFKLTTAASTAAVTIKGGAGSDTLTIGNAAGAAAINLITGGKGADSVTLGTGTYTIVQAKGDSLTVTSLTNGMVLTGADQVTGAAASDKFNTGNSALATITNDLATMPTTLANDAAYIVEGVFNTTTKTFIAGGTATDTLVVYDADSTTATQFEAVVLVGQASLGVNTVTGGLITLV